MDSLPIEIALAFNLAYLELERFHVRKKILKAATLCVERLDKGVTDEIKSSCNSYRILYNFMRVGGDSSSLVTQVYDGSSKIPPEWNDFGDDVDCLYDQVKGETRNVKKSKPAMPKGWQNPLYKHLFKKRLDTFFSATATFLILLLCVILPMLGGPDIDNLSEGSWLSIINIIKYKQIFLVCFGIFWPIFCFILGGRVCSWAIEECENAADELEAQVAALATKKIESTANPTPNTGSSNPKVTRI